MMFRRPAFGPWFGNVVEDRNPSVLSKMMPLMLFGMVLLLCSCAGAPPEPQTEPQKTHVITGEEDDDRASGPDGTPRGARLLALNTVVSDSVSVPQGDKTDWYYLDFAKEGHLRITLDIAAPQNDLNIILYDTTGDVAASSRGDSNVSREVIEIPVSRGRYYLRVYAVEKTDESAYQLENIFESGQHFPMEMREARTGGTSIPVGVREEPARVPSVETRQRPGTDEKETDMWEAIERELPLPGASESRVLPTLPELARLESDQGLVLEQITPEHVRRLGLLEVRGIVIVTVEEGSPAQRAGLRPGDIVLAMDERPVGGMRAFDERIRQYRRGDTVLLMIKRGFDVLYMLLKVEKRV